MIKPGPDGWLLDTSVVIHLVRRTPTGAALTTGYAIDGVSCPAYLCVVSHGEVESFALYNNWGARRQRALAALLRRLRGPVDLSPRDVIESYARIDHASRAVGRRMGKNDLWIAAVAYAYQLTLLTTDADFDHLHAAGWLDVVRQPVLP